MSRQGFALIALQHSILPQWIALTADQSMDRITPQMVVIIEIFVVKYQTINPLAHQILQYLVQDRSLRT
jgi:uncharacterized protein with PQ loop repeat